MPEIKFSKSYQHFGEIRVDVFTDEPISSDKATAEIFLQKSFCSGLWNICREGFFKISQDAVANNNGIIWGFQGLAGEFSLREAKKRVAEMDLTYKAGSYIRARGMNLVSYSYLGKGALEHE
jgi:hypothetical protein